MQSIQDLKKLFDDVAGNYDSITNTFHHKVFEYVLYKHLLNELNNDKSLKILDSGGGTGKYSLLLASMGYNVELIDISPESISIANNKFESNGLDFKTSVQNSEETNYPDNYFDFVMLNGAVISYTLNPAKLLIECNRILKPNGKLFFDFYNTIGWCIEIKNPELVSEIVKADSFEIQMPDWTYPARLFNIKHMEDLLRKAGFVNNAIRGLISVSHTFPLDYRYSMSYVDATVKKYQEIEFQLSNENNCYGSAWSCNMCCKKIN